LIIYQDGYLKIFMKKFLAFVATSAILSLFCQSLFVGIMLGLLALVATLIEDKEAAKEASKIDYYSR